VGKSVLVAFAPKNGAASFTPVEVHCHGCDQAVVNGDRGFILDSAGVTVWHHDCYLEAAEITSAVDWAQRRTEPAAEMATHSWSIAT
jgi:hypothetical protein